MSSTDPFDDGDGRTYTEEAYEKGAYEEARPEADERSAHDDAYREFRGDRSVGREGSLVGDSLALLLFVVGLVLFLFPEPGTSALGLALMVGGIVVWAVDAIR